MLLKLFLCGALCAGAQLQGMNIAQARLSQNDVLQAMFYIAIARMDVANQAERPKAACPERFAEEKFYQRQENKHAKQVARMKRWQPKHVHYAQHKKHIRD